MTRGALDALVRLALLAFPARLRARLGPEIRATMTDLAGDRRRVKGRLATLGWTIRALPIPRRTS